VRVLAVDDDVISRQAVSTALKKVFGAPDLAADGAAGLSLASVHAYDVIFLDVEMPGMDGFELCSKIQETVQNQKTPVVFVTSHTDFDSRAKSALSGGQDFLGKPFLAFELALKALTLVVSNRLGDKKAEGVPATPLAASNPGGTTLALTTRTPEAQEKSNIIELVAHREAAASSSALPGTGSKVQSSGDAVNAMSEKDTRRENQVSVGKTKESAGDVAETFFENAPSNVETLRKILNLLRASETETARQEELGALFVSVHTLTEEAGSAKIDSIHRLGSGLENMLKKLLEKPKQITSSSLDTAAAAIQLMEELSINRLDPKLGEVRIMVVDDDLISRRAVAGSVQIIFGKPETADCGEAALALAAEKPFDLVFMDVRMPGMDGFIACSKIHETAPNSATPVVFVTGQSDSAARKQAILCGGEGFITKPILASEISLTALIFALRGEMRKLKAVEEEALV
jgi:CheY-like chemotaxis protein